MMDPVRILQHVHSLPRQIAQFPNLARWHPTAPQLAAFQQYRNPLGILGIGLVAIQSFCAKAKMCCGFTRISFSKWPSSTFHIARQYWPVDAIAISVTLQLLNHVRSCLRSRVKVGKFLLRICTSGLPTGGKMQTVTLFLCTSMPQQRRYLGSITSFRSRAKDAWKLMAIRHSYACSSASRRRQQFLVPVSAS